MEFDTIDYYEPGQAEIILDELAVKMREALTDKIKYEIEALHKENTSLKEQNKKLTEEAYAVKSKERQLEDKEKHLEYQFYKKKFNEFLQPFLDNIEVYDASHEPHEQEKCEYCNEERKLLFTASNGKTELKICDCAHRKYWWEPKKVSLHKIEFYKKTYDGYTFYGIAHFYNEKDGDRYFKVDLQMLLDEFTDETLELVKKLKYEHRIVFKSQEECQKYCDWKNKEKPNG